MNVHDKSHTVMTRRRPTKRDIRALIDFTEVNYTKCWNILVSMKPGSGVQFDATEFLTFQWTLCVALMELERFYGITAREQKRLIAEKPQMSAVWFRNQMARLDEYRQLIERVISIGKTLGNAFAWFFYQNDRPFLMAHAAQQRQLHLPLGIGGLGEYAFIRNTRHVDGQFVLYHGITTILRLGDVSLIDLKSWKVTALGELKTEKTGDAKLTVHVVLMGQKPTSGTVGDNSTRHDMQHQMSLSPSALDRFQRQQRRMASMISEETQREAGLSLAVTDKTYSAELDVFLGRIKRDQFSYQQLGNGLLLAGYGRRKSSLYGRLTGRGPHSFDLDALPEHAVKILSSDSHRSRISIADLEDSTQAHLLMGGVPLFWRQIDAANLRKVILQEVLLVTIYNPGHLFAKLEAAGFTLKLEVGEHQFSVARQAGHRMVGIDRCGHFTLMVQHGLCTEEKVVEMMVMACDEMEVHAEKHGDGVNLRGDLMVNQML